MNDDSVVVIGSGFGGAIVAARLAEAGFNVTLLERGPWRDTVPTRSMGIMRRVAFPRGARMFTRLIRTLNSRCLPGGRITLSKYGLFEVFFSPGLDIVCSSNVGGGSHVYSALQRLPAVPDYWNGHHPEISTAVMQPHYEAVLARMGSVVPTPQHRIPNTTAARYQGHPTLAAPTVTVPTWFGHLLPGDPDNPRMTVDHNGIERHEIDYAKYDDGFLGSPNGGKTTLDIAYLAPAMKAGLKVRDLCEVRLIHRLSSSSLRRYRVEFKNHNSGSVETIDTDHLFVAAGTLNTLRLLLHSRDVAGSLSGMPNLGKRFGANGDRMGLWDLNDPNQRIDRGLPTQGGLVIKEETDPVPVGGGGWPSIDSYPLPRRIKDRLRRAAMVFAVGVDSMDGRFSMCGRRLHLDFNPESSPIFARLKQTFRRMAYLSKRPIYFRERPITAHPTGGCALADKVEHGVIDANGEVFDNPGLYITDGAALPGSLGAPPSLSIAAWADQCATRFIERHKKSSAGTAIEFQTGAYLHSRPTNSDESLAVEIAAPATNNQR